MNPELRFRMKRLMVLLAFVLVLQAQAAVAQTGSGQITGQLVNKSKEDGSVAGVPLKLSTYAKTTLQGSVEGKTDAEGKFSFTGLATEKTTSYQVSFNYQGADYFSDRVWYEEGETSKSLDMPVYNTTTSDEGVKVGAWHTIIYTSNDGLLVKEFYLFKNDGDKAFVGKEGRDGKKETLRFSLPQGATGVQYGQGLSEARVIKTADGFVHTSAVVPGDTFIGFSYALPGVRDYLVRRSIAYAVDNLDVLVEDKGVAVTSPQLSSQEPVVMKEGRFILLLGQGFAPGAAHEVSVRVIAPGEQSGVLPFAAVGVAGALGIGAVYFLATRKKQASGGPSLAAEGPASERERLLEEIASLDDEYEAGAVSEEEYEELRSEKKARLLRLTGKQARG